MPLQSSALTAAQINSFIADGFVRIDDAFPAETAAECRAILWRETGCNPDDPATWTRPVVRLGGYSQPCFDRAANGPRLLAAFDQLVGEGRWLPRHSLGGCVIRFPSPDDPGDTGWHIDASFALPGDDQANFMNWRANIVSRDRALLMLFLFSDVGADDAPTRIRVGSHASIARRLAPTGADGLTLGQLAATGFAESAPCPEVSATGEAGTVYLCHPFLVHAGQPHHGRVPRFLAQPPLLPRQPFQLVRDDGAYAPVEIAIRDALT